MTLQPAPRQTRQAAFDDKQYPADFLSQEAK